jgi:glycosyltransferase involved in cell wall biosynthesis
MVTSDRSGLPKSSTNDLHVLLLPSSYPTVASPIAGVFCRDQARALADVGVRVGVVYPDRRSLRTLSPRALWGQHGQTTTAVEGGNTTMRWSGWNIPQPELSGRLFRWMAVRLVDRYIRRHGLPDLIHAHDAVWGGAAASQAADRYGLPYVLTEHSSGYLLGEIRDEAAGWAFLAYRKASRVIAVSRYLAASIAPFGADPKALAVIGNVVDTEFFSLPESPRRPAARTRFLCLAQLQRAKGVDLLLRSFAGAVAGRDWATLEIGGGNRGWEELKELATSLGISDRVTFLGGLSRHEVREALWRADALVVSSYVETFGVVLAEALATGLPVITTRCGGPEDIVSANLGQFVPVGDQTALTQALVAFDVAAELDLDRARQRRASIVDRFSSPVIGERLRRLYGEVLGSDRARGQRA